MSELSLPETRAARPPVALAPAAHAVAIGLPAAVGMTALAAADGAYFPTAWGWSALLLVWMAALVLLLRQTVALTRLEVALLSALAGLAGWVWLSTAWSRTFGASVLEGQRILVYLAAGAAVLLLARRSTLPLLLGGLLVGLVAAAGYGLATRLFPDRLGSYDVVAGYRLSEPLGYWNALGIFSALGALVAFGFAAHGRTAAARAAAAASLVVLLPTLYFTFSRGSWIALAIGIAAAIALTPQRLRFVTALLVAAPPPAIAVWLASQSDALTRQRSALADATRDGHRLALWLLALAALAVALSLARDLLDRHLRFGGLLRRAYGAALALSVAAGLAAVLVQYGGPVRIGERAYDAFNAPPPHVRVDLNERLFSFSGSGRADLWRAAWRQFEEHPWLGSGAGSYEQYWYEHRTLDLKVRDAHSLYFETIGELGVVGLGLLTFVLGVPILAAVRARRHALVPVAFGAYVAYLAHAGVDWDWEVPAVTVTALLCGAACVVAARSDERPGPLRRGVRVGSVAGAVVLSAVAFVGLVGNSALAESEDAVRAGRWDIAEIQARRAMRWAPWSAEAWQRLGEVEVALSNPAGARDHFRRAIAKDPRNWLLWYELASVARGEERREAARRVVRLNPRSAEAVEMREVAGL